MNIQEKRALLIHDRKNKLFSMKIALEIHEDEAYQQLLKQYRRVCRQLNHIDKSILPILGKSD